jgi:LPS-assembly lipoprotein
MSWSDRRIFLISLAALAGCGFTPAYAPGGAATALTGAVAADVPTTRDDFAFTRRLAERFGPVQSARFRLTYEISTTAAGQAITPDNITTRFSLTGTVGYRLLDAASGTELMSGEVGNFTSWSASGSTVATLTAEADAHERLMRLLADQVVTRLVAAAATLPQ